jgi:class 3 adenylate cyclase
MEPRVQYGKTSDGVSIAFWTLGDGPPFVRMPFPFTHLQLMWEVPEFRAWAERQAQKRQFVEYDWRGTGLSDRNVTDFSLQASVRDLEAVVDRLGLERFALFAPVFSGPVGIAYTYSHPERVTHLILWCTGEHGAGMIGPRTEALVRLAGADWDAYFETVAHIALGWSAGEKARQYAAVMRESITPEGFQAILAAALDFDVTGLLAKVRSPTMILHRRDYAFASVDAARGLASRIPDASLVLLEGDSGSPMLGDTETVHRAIDEFLGDGEEATAKGEPSAFRTVLFTDVEGSTALTDRLGDAKARELLRAHERLVREALKAHGGSEVKALGDGFMASFSSATKALECAIAIQSAFAERNESAEEPILVRVGLNAGEPIAEDEDLFGASVNRAARIAAMAQGGEILAANVVRELADGKGFTFADNGEATLNGFEKPVRLHEVRWRDD